MSSRARITKILNLKSHETSTVVGMMAHAFFSGLGVALAFTTVNVLLLENHGSEVLPSIYGFASLLLLFGGFIYSKLEHKTQPFKLFMWMLAISAVWAIAARIFMFQSSLLIFGGVYCTYFLIYQLNNLEYWGAAALLYDLRQSKRLFGLLSAGESSAKILGYAITPFLIKLFSLEDLLIVSGLSFVASGIILFKLGKSNKDSFEMDLHSHHSNHDEQMRQIKFGKIGKLIKADNFTRNVALFALASTLVYYTIHFAFLSEVEARFHNQKDLAFFFGLFFGIAKAVNLIIKSFLSGRLLNFLGIRVMIMILPFTLVLINLIGISGGFALSDSIKFFIYIFGLNMLADEIFRSSLHKPSYLILFQPLAKNKRLEGHTLSKGIMEPIGMGLAGLVILLLQYLGIFTLPKLSGFILVFVLVWLLLSWMVSNDYKDLLQRVLKSRLLTKRNVNYSKDEMNILKTEKLHSDDPLERLYALKLLDGHINKESYNSVLRELLSVNNPGLQFEVLQMVEEKNLVELAHDVKAICHSEDLTLSKKAIFCFCALMEEESVDELKTIFSDFSEEQQEAIIAGILKSSGIYGATEVGKFLLQMIHSDEASSRIKAARIIGNIGKKDFYHPLIALLNDPDEGVQKEAILAAGKVQNLKLVPPLLEHIKENILHNHCFRALEKIGPDSLDSIIQLMNESSDVHLLRRLVRLCSKFSSEKSVHFLLKHLKHPVELVRSEVIYSLFILNFKAQEKEIGLVEEELHNEIMVFRNLEHVLKISDATHVELLRSSVKSEIKMIQHRCLQLLSFIYEKSSILRIGDSLRANTREYRSNACEMLENLLSHRHAQSFVPLFEIELEELIAEAVNKNDKESLIETIVQVPHGYLSDWLTALSIRITRELNGSISKPLMETLKKLKSKVVDEELEFYELKT